MPTHILSFVEVDWHVLFMACQNMHLHMELLDVMIHSQPLEENQVSSLIDFSKSKNPMPFMKDG